MTDLLAIADLLYAEPPAAFTAARDALAKEQDDKAFAKQLKALKKPTAAAWAVNLLVRRETEQIDQMLAVAPALREAAQSMDGAQLRSLTRQRRQLTTTLANAARGLAREYDVKLSAATVEQVEAMLNSAMLDPQASEVVRSGLVLTAFTATGVGDWDAAAVVALPDALGFSATAVQRPKPSLRVVPEDDSVRRARAEDAVAQAEEELAKARTDLDQIVQSLGELDARRLQLAEEIDESKRRLAALEDDLDGVEDDIEVGEAARDEAQADLTRAEELVQTRKGELAAFD